MVAIVGRPNVGKSSLFNRMLRRGQERRPKAITEETPGVTRDRNYGFARWEDRDFTVIDTGGFYPEGLPHEVDEIAGQVKEQALFAIDEADLIIHLMDSREGLLPADREMAVMLRASGKKILWVINKVDGPSKDGLIADFYALGAGTVFPVSAVTGYGFEELMDRVVAELPGEKTEAPTEAHLPKVAVIGKPNVGKSTLINALLGKKRLIVSPIPGTTRDAIDSVCTYYGEKFLFIDTAGIRKKPREYSVEGLSLMRTMRSVERADVAVIVIDATQGIGEQDQHIAGLSAELGKSALLVLNKWDAVEDPETRYKAFAKEIKRKLWFLDYAPWITTSGLRKTRITNLFPLLRQVLAERGKQIATSTLNDFVRKVLERKPFPPYRGKELKFYYITQTGSAPPVFTVFVNYPAGIREEHLRYLEKAVRAEYSFTGTPIRIIAKPRRKSGI